MSSLTGISSSRFWFHACCFHLLTDNLLVTHLSYVGIICSKTSPYEIVKRAIDDAAFMCTRKYGDAPEVIITGRLDM